MRDMRHRARQAARGRHPRRARAASWTARSSTGYKLQKVMVPGLRALFSGQVSRFRGQAAAHPPGVRADRGERRASARSSRSTRRPGVRLLAIAPLRAPGARAARGPHGSAAGVAAARGRPVRAGAGAAPHPPARDRGGQYTPRRHRLVWDEAMGVQLALALRRQADRRSGPPRPCPPRPGRPAGGVRRPAAVRAHRRPAGGRRGDRGGSGGRAPDEPAACRATSARARRSWRCGRCCRSSTRAARPRCWRPPRCSPRSTPARCARCSGRSARPASWARPSSATRVTLLTGFAAGAKAKKQALLEALSGEAGIVVGTHALIQDRVEFAELGLVVVDEQHRFGVEQRDALRGPRRARRRTCW